MTRLTPKLHSLMTLVSPKSLKCNISMNNGPSAVSIEACIYRVNMAHMVLCVRFSSETTQPIYPMMIPINWGNNVDVQRALHFDLDPSMTPGQGREILWFWEFRCLTGSRLCSLLLRNYSTDFSNDDTNQLREQCRCATCNSFWPWPLHDSRSKSRNTSILGI